jgi:hypothetical protein
MTDFVSRPWQPTLSTLRLPFFNPQRNDATTRMSRGGKRLRLMNWSWFSSPNSNVGGGGG